jgi:FixJ family two-component response regulator
MNGRELADRAVVCRPDMHVLFMSGYMDEMLGSITQEEREARFIEKPFSPDAMVRKVRQVLDASGAKHALAVRNNAALDRAGRHG